MLPDILCYDRAQGSCLNGRILTDMVFDIRMALLANGNAASDGLVPHDDLLAELT